MGSGHVVIILIIISLSLITIPVFAQVIDFTTDKELYYQFQTITLSGVVDVDPDISDIFIEIFSPQGKLAGFDRNINPDGTFIIPLQANPDVYTIDGVYTYKITYINSVEKTINYKKWRDIAPFVDLSKDPCSYVNRYDNEPAFEKWFRDNYPEYIGIHEAVGLTDPKTKNCKPEMSEAEKQAREEIQNPCANIKEPKVAPEYQGNIHLATPDYMDALRDAQSQYQQQLQLCLREYEIQIAEKVCGAGNVLKDGQCVAEQITLSAYDTSPELQKVHAQRCGIKYNPSLRITFNPDPPPFPGCFFDAGFARLSFNEAVEFYGADQIVCLEPLIYRPEVNGCWGTKEAQEELIEKQQQSTESICGPGTILNEENQCVPARETMTTEMQQKSSNGGGCLIATATFGSELSPQVQQLREFRDNTLLQTNSGSTFMTGFNQFYYSFSPTIADWERQNPVFRDAVKLTITPLITSLSLLNYADIDSEAEVLVYGISLILLNIGMYVVAPVGIGLVLIRKI